MYDAIYSVISSHSFTFNVLHPHPSFLYGISVHAFYTIIMPVPLNRFKLLFQCVGGWDGSWIRLGWLCWITLPSCRLVFILDDYSVKFIYQAMSRINAVLRTRIYKWVLWLWWSCQITLRSYFLLNDYSVKFIIIKHIKDKHCKSHSYIVHVFSSSTRNFIGLLVKFIQDALCFNRQYVHG